MVRSTVAHVDLAALQHNFTAIRSFLQQEGSTTPPDVIAVVKANAYGHGSERVARALEQAGAAMLACADIEEGVVLRRAGVGLPILVFGALSVSDLDGLFEFALTPTISTPSAARAVQTAAARHRATLGYHLKIDTGMNRLGFRHDNVRRTLPALLASSNLKLDAVYTHFASADIPESATFAEQREHFDAAWDTLGELGAHGCTTGASGQEREGAVASGRGKDVGMASGARDGRVRRHAANSAALLRDSRVWYDMVRP